ncbi:AraC family transcriptional regulator [Curtobacterium sp. MCSS17_007]|uniref:helix-turn-helix transcriptional regulator n=1 Tax=Curtobacterium sp. MCSS17_007 TaxID=2175646 RepID=UPI000DA7A8E2|nr:AraC family transcriptional regulator [Curtobacterium sp. MCSS17_007]WIE75197.1 helix-turn-helix transcriptional regulator [Curtobacterium sp. MCSS17_007]
MAVTGDDTDAAIRSLAGMYAGKRWYSRPTDHEYWFKYVGIGDSELSVRRSQMHGYLRGEIATEQEVVVQWLDQGTARLDVGRNEIRMRRGTPTMFPVDRRFEVECQDWDQRLVHVSKALVLDVAAERYLVDRAVVFDHMAGPDIAAVGPWQASLSTAVQVLRETGASSLAWHEAQRELTRTLLRLFPPQAERLPPRYGARQNRPVRAAVEFIHAHAHTRLTISDVAAAAEMSVRGLQESFQRVLGRTPMEYVRDVRLGRAYEELRTADPAETSVREAAQKWGFTHMGRFSATFRARYGEYPKQTLRR